MWLDVGGAGPGLVPESEAKLPVRERGFLLGDGLFESILVRDGVVPLLEPHVTRLTASAAFLRFPADPAHVRFACRTVAESLGLGEFALRLTYTRGAGSRGYSVPHDPQPTLAVFADPYHRPHGPIALVTSRWAIDVANPLHGHKTTSALERVLARSEAEDANADDVLRLNLAGRVAETTAWNVFVVKRGLWRTPPVTEGCLRGVMRARVISLLGAEEAVIHPGELEHADAIFLTNALAGCVPVGSVDGAAIPVGRVEAPSIEDLLAEA